MLPASILPTFGVAGIASQFIAQLNSLSVANNNSPELQCTRGVHCRQYDLNCCISANVGHRLRLSFDYLVSHTHEQII